MNRQHVFLSYSRHDRPFADRLSADLRSAGIDTWMDVNEIAPGENWEKTIESALSTAAALLYISSEHSAASSWMALETQTVFAKSVKVIPLIISDEGERALPLFLRSLQWVDFRG